MPNVKATDLLSIRAIAKEENALKSITERLPPEDQARLMKCVAVDWVPLDSATRIFGAAAEALYPGDPRGIWKLSQACARDHINNIYKLFLPLISSPSHVIKRAATLWETFYDQGTGAITDGGVDQKFAVFTVTGSPDLTPVNREFIAGWSCALIEMTGAKLVTVEKSEPRPKVWAWRFTWK